MAEMELKERKSVGIGRAGDGLGVQLQETEIERARIYDALAHEEDWWHAIKANPKALLWCEYCLRLRQLQRC